MGKKIRSMYLKGMLLRPFFRLINKVEVGINPVSDPHGTKIAQHYYKLANQTKSLYKGEKFTSSINYDLTSNSSWIIFHYLNGYRKGFHLKHFQNTQFELDQTLINSIVEFERVCQGFDDDLPDEAWTKPTSKI